MITATLAPGVYSPAQSVAATMTATSSSSDIGVTTPYLWIAQGASVSVPLTARVVSLGAPQRGVTVNFMIAQGSGSLSAASAVTNSQGYASVTLTLTDFSTSVQLSACVAPGNNPCQNIYGNAVAAAMLNLQAVAGAGQVVSGTAFQPLTVRVTDNSTPPNPSPRGERLVSIHRAASGGRQSNAGACGSHRYSNGNARDPQRKPEHDCE